MTYTAPAGGDRRFVTGLFMDDDAAARAFEACVERGYDVGDVNVLMSEDTRRRLVADDSAITSRMAERRAEGGELGGPAGGRAALLITVFAAVGTAVALPALGLVMAGPLAAALVGAGTAGLAAGLAGALGDWGLPADRARWYQAGIQEGGILIGVQPRSADDARLIGSEWKALGARHVDS
jgi:hypothetical protein